MLLCSACSAPQSYGGRGTGARLHPHVLESSRKLGFRREKWWRGGGEAGENDKEENTRKQCVVRTRRGKRGWRNSAACAGASILLSLPFSLPFTFSLPSLSSPGPSHLASPGAHTNTVSGATNTQVLTSPVSRCLLYEQTQNRTTTPRNDRLRWAK